MSKWIFPPNNDGREDGLNNPGIETFLDHPRRSLAREVAQNSCDARGSQATGPVEIHFSLQEWPRAKFPDADGLEKILKWCEKYWRKNEKTAAFVGKAREVLNRPKIDVLRVSDFNTTGLGGR